MFELNQLEQLIAIAECQTISAAAERLHLSQPALSRSIQKLEAALQVTLFDRKKNKIALNESGKIAVEYARRVLEQASNMTEQLQALDRSRRTVSLGSCAPAPLWDLAPLVSRLYPQKALISEMKETGALLQGMKDGTYQLVILPCPAEESALCCTAFESEQLYFALPPEHPLANAKGLHFKDLDGQAILMFSEIGFWKKVQQKMMPKTHTLIQENRADHRFHGIGNHGGTFPSSGLILSLSQIQIITQGDLLRAVGQRRLADQAGPELRHLSLRHLRKLVIKKIAGNQLQHRVA